MTNNITKFLRYNLFLIAVTSVALISFSATADAALSTIYRSLTSEPDLLPNLPIGNDGSGAKSNPSFSTPIINNLQSTLGFTSFTRIDDAADQLWSPVGNSQTATLLGKFAGDTESFGIVNGNSGGTYSQVTAALGSTGSYISGVPVSFTAAQVFRLALSNTTTGSLLTSVNSQNSDGQDHFATFLINDGAFAGDYIVAIEDLLQGQQSWDFDFNDNIILLSGVTVSVPEPATYLILGGTLLAATILLRRREREVIA